MEAKDTGRYTHNHVIPTCECRACIHPEGFQAGYEQGKVEGRREVLGAVEIVREIGGEEYALIPVSKLKEWGIND